MKTITIRLNDREEIYLTELVKWANEENKYKTVNQSNLIRFLITEQYYQIKQKNK